MCSVTLKSDGSIGKSIDLYCVSRLFIFNNSAHDASVREEMIINQSFKFKCSLKENSKKKRNQIHNQIFYKKKFQIKNMSIQNK